MVKASASSRVFVTLLGLFLAGCGGSDNPSRGNGGGTGGTGGTGAGGATGVGGVAGGPCTPRSCSDLEFCATCGPSAGKCFYRPQDCITQPGPAVCGCDGNLYMTECEANGSRMAITGSAFCPAPPGTFQCGTKFCTHGSQYCQTWYLNDQMTNLGRYVARYACVDLPAAQCGATPTCACVTSAECGDCAVSADGDLTAGCLLAP